MWWSWAVKAGKAAAAHPKVGEQATTIIGGTVITAGKSGVHQVTDLRQRREDVRNAIRHARDLDGGRYSLNVKVAGKVRQLVWKDGKAIFAYPMLTEEELGDKPLAERLELQHFPSHLMLAPPNLDGRNRSRPWRRHDTDAATDPDLGADS